MTHHGREGVPAPAVGPRSEVRDDPASRSLPSEFVDLLQEHLDALLRRAGVGHAACSVRHPEGTPPPPAVSLAVAVRQGWRVAEARADDAHHKITVHPVELPPDVAEEAAVARLAAATMAVRVALHAHDRGRGVGALPDVLDRGLRRDAGFPPRRWSNGSLRVGVSGLAARRHELEGVAHRLLYPKPLPRPRLPDLPTMPPVGPGATRSQLTSAIRAFLRQHGVSAKARSISQPDPGIVVSYLDGPPSHLVEGALRRLPEVIVRRVTSPRARATAVVLFAGTYGRPPSTRDDIVELERLLASGDVLTLIDEPIARQLRELRHAMGGVVADDIAVIARRYAEAIAT